MTLDHFFHMVWPALPSFQSAEAMPGSSACGKSGRFVAAWRSSTIALGDASTDCGRIQAGTPAFIRTGHFFIHFHPLGITSRYRDLEWGLIAFLVNQLGFCHDQTYQVLNPSGNALIFDTAFCSGQHLQSYDFSFTFLKLQQAEQAGGVFRIQRPSGIWFNGENCNHVRKISWSFEIFGMMVFSWPSWSVICIFKDIRIHMSPYFYANKELLLHFL